MITCSQFGPLSTIRAAIFLCGLLLATSGHSAPAAKDAKPDQQITSRTALAAPNSNCANDPVCPQWVTRYDGAGGYDRGIGIVMSPDGQRIYAMGASTGASTGLDIVTIAYDAVSGQQVWLSRFNGPADHNDTPFVFGTGKQIAISPDGSKVFVTGSSTGSNGYPSYITVAYNTADGAQLWASIYSTPQGSNATSIAISRDGSRTFVTGFSAVALKNGAPNYDFATVAYDTQTGNQLWAARYDGPALFWDIPYSMGVGNVRQADGTLREQVFVTGRSDSASGDEDFATVAYDALTGSQLWVTRYDGPAHGDDEGFGLGVTPDGSTVFVTGPSLEGDGNQHYATVSYNALTGAQQWVGRYNNGGFDEPVGLAVSSAGDRVAVTGFSLNAVAGFGTPEIRDAATVVYDAETGLQLWVGRHSEPDAAATTAVTFSHDGHRLYITGLENGNVVAVGQLGGPIIEAGHSPGLTVAYDAANGTELWATHYIGPAGDEGGSDLVVSPDDNYVYVTGGGQSAAADVSTLAYPTGALPQITSNWISPNGLTPTARSDAMMAYDSTRQQILLFGGAVGGGGLAGLNNETWLLTASNWTQAGPQNFPYGRVNAGIAYDEARQQIVLFGGYTASTIQFGDTNDTWIWDGTNWSEIAAPVGSNSIPAAREAPAMAYDSDSDLTILFGGVSVSSSQTTVQSDTWSWNGATWSQLTPATSPPARYAATMVYDVARHQLVLFGGSGLNETWTWDGTNWTEASSTNRPPGRSYACATYDRDRGVVLLYGGIDGSGNALNDTWTWDGTNWTQQQPVHTPGARGDSVITYDPAQHRAFLYGGINGSTAFGDTWSWDGNDWQSLGEARQPTARLGAPMNYDPRLKKTVLFGGVGGGTAGFSSETWTWDGTGWAQLIPAVTPSGRGYTPLVEDPEVGRLVMFGGFAPSGVLNDTWSWDGFSWIQEQPTHSPSPRTNPQLAFDGNHLLLYGGYDGHGNVFGDTWSWNGNDWTQLTPANSPPPLNGGAMTYDPIHHRVVLFGGSTGGGVGAFISANVGTPVAETWTWDGTNWTQQNPAHSPPAVSGHSMIYDAELGGVVLFEGGQSATRSDVLGPKGLFNNDLWLWNGVDWVQVTATVVPGPRGFESLSYDSDRHALVLYGGNGAHGVQGDTWTFAPPLPQLTGVVSRKLHAGAGAFDVNLTNSNAVECRSGGPNGNYTLVFSFANPLSDVDSALVSSGNGAVVSGSIDSSDAHNYVVTLTNVANAQKITIALNKVADSAGNFGSSISASMNVLIGDTNSDGVVNSADIGQTKSQSGTTTSNSNFREDLNTDGGINSADIGLVKSKSGTALP